MEEPGSTGKAGAREGHRGGCRPPPPNLGQTWSGGRDDRAERAEVGRCATVRLATTRERGREQRARCAAHSEV